MFNPEKLLGGMLRSSGRGRGLGSLVTGGAALGLVGVAMEAVEHFMNKSGATADSGPPGAPPPAPGAVSGTAHGAPPPPPGKTGSPPPPPPSPSSGPGAGPEPHGEAVLLIRAMIAAANADGAIDADERGNILGKLKAVDLSTEEHEFIVHELLAPKPIEALLESVRTPELARQVYAASLLAIEVDTDAERRYLHQLSQKLGLNDQDVDDICRQLGVATP